MSDPTTPDTKQDLELVILSFNKEGGIYKITTTAKGQPFKVGMFVKSFDNNKADIDAAIDSGKAETWTIEDKRKAGAEKPDYFLLWKKKENARGGGGYRKGGGAAQSDPVKNANIKAANCLNNATTCMDMAVRLVGASGDETLVYACAHRLAKGVLELKKVFEDAK